MSNEKAVTVREYDLQGTALERYGSRSVARELMRRLMMLHPEAAQVGEAGMLAAAQLAIVVGANPMPATNEIHVWKAGSKVSIDLGINFFRRRANELGGIYWVEDPRMMTEQECEEYGINYQTVIGAIAKGARMDKVREMMAMGLPWEAAVKGVTRVGVGIVNRGATAKQGRPLSWTALKAAEKDLCRALFPNFEQPPEASYWLDVVPNGNGDSTRDDLSATELEALTVLEAQYDESTTAWETMTPDEQQETAATNSAIIYGDHDEDDPFGADSLPWDGDTFDAGEDEPEPEPEPPPPQTHGRPLPAETIRDVIRKKAGFIDGRRHVAGEPITEKQIGFLAGLIGKALPNLDNASKNKARHDVLSYLIGVDSTKQLMLREASALIDWLAGDDGDVNQYAAAEVASVLQAVAIEQGQQELGL